ncbi:hypothetical protein VTO42DRAFT_9022 [Malbranchea cinnamomea]
MFETCVFPGFALITSKWYKIEEQAIRVGLWYAFSGLGVSAGGFLAYAVSLNARWLKKEDRVLAVERVRTNQQGIGNKPFKKHQFKEAMTDPMTWAFAFCGVVSSIPFGGMVVFFTQLHKGLGFDREVSLLYGTPRGASLCYFRPRHGFVGTYFKKQIFVGSLGFYLAHASPTGFTTLLGLVASNVAGYTKKTTVAAIFALAFCSGQIIGTSKCGFWRYL